MKAATPTDARGQCGEMWPLRGHPRFFVLSRGVEECGCETQIYDRNEAIRAEAKEGGGLGLFRIFTALQRQAEARMQKCIQPSTLSVCVWSNFSSHIKGVIYVASLTSGHGLTRPTVIAEVPLAEVQSFQRDSIESSVAQFLSSVHPTAARPLRGFVTGQYLCARDGPLQKDSII